MNNQKQLKKYTKKFIEEFSKYVKEGFKFDVVIHPAKSAGAIIEFNVKNILRNNIQLDDEANRVSDILKKIDQKLIGGNVEGVTFKGTNLYFEGNRILIVKGEDEHKEWNNSAVVEDIKRIVSHKGERNV